MVDNIEISILSYQYQFPIQHRYFINITHTFPLVPTPLNIITCNYNFVVDKCNNNNFIPNQLLEASTDLYFLKYLLSLT